MSTSPSAATCVRCSTPLDGRTGTCATCGHVAGVGAPSTSLMPAAPVAPPYPQAPVHVVSAKSPGVGVLLSFLWLGAGHLYVGRIGLGIGLMVFDFFLVLLSIIPIIWIITVPVWLIAFVFVALNVANAAKAFNLRNGIVVH